MPMREKSAQLVLVDTKLAPNGAVELSFNQENPTWVYAYGGSTGDLNLRTLGVNQEGCSLLLQATPLGAELLVLSGGPTNAPLGQYDSFVMNTAAEVEADLNRC